MGKREPALFIWLGPWATCPPGEPQLQGHLHLSSPVVPSPPELCSLGREGAPSSMQVPLPGWVPPVGLAQGLWQGLLSPHTVQEQEQEPPIAPVYSLAVCKRWRKSPAWKIQNKRLVFKDFSQSHGSLSFLTAQPASSRGLELCFQKLSLSFLRATCPIHFGDVWVGHEDLLFAEIQCQVPMMLK